MTDVDRVLGAQLAIPDLYAGPCAPDPVWGEVWPDWIAPSPLGNYLVVQWRRDGTARCSGLETFDLRSGAFVGRVSDGHQHGDLGVSADGREFFMTYELYNPDGHLYIGYRWLPGPSTGMAVPNYLRQLAWDLASSDPGNGWQPFETELFLLSLDGSVLRLAHHRSSECGYWAQPRATLSLDGKLVLFASDWGIQPCAAADGNPDPYLLAITSGGSSSDLNDFNGDGKGDILWRHTDGAVAIWLMNGGTIASVGLPGGVATDWTIAAGAVAVWLMNGGAVASVGLPGGVSMDWTIAGVGDVNGDGKADIVWRHAAGAVAVWLMNGGAVGSVALPGGVSTDWVIQ